MRGRGGLVGSGGVGMSVGKRVKGKEVAGGGGKEGMPRGQGHGEERVMGQQGNLWEAWKGRKVEEGEASGQEGVGYM